MKIQGVPFENNGINNASGKTTRKVSTAQVDIRKYSETAGVSGSASGIDRVDESSFVIETEFQPRAELLESISRRIEHGEYNAQALLETVAGKVIESLVTSDVSSSHQEDSVQADKVSDVTDNVENNYYNTPDVIRETAARIVSALGLESIFGSERNG